MSRTRYATDASVAAAAAATNVPVAITFTANAPTPAATNTIADGAVPTVAELGQLAADSEVFQAAVSADVTAVKAELALIRTKLGF